MAGAATDSGDPRDLAGLSQALDAFLRQAPLSEPYVVTTLGAYRALNVRRFPGAPLELLLLGGDAGTVYVPTTDAAAPAGSPGRDLPVPGVLEALQRRRLRPTGTSLALRLPAQIGGAGASPGRFTQWASPAYLAAGGEGGTIWK